MKLAEEIAEMMLDAFVSGIVPSTMSTDHAMCPTMTRGNLEMNIAAKLEPVREALDDIIVGIEEIRAGGGKIDSQQLREAKAALALLSDEE